MDDQTPNIAATIQELVERTQRTQYAEDEGKPFVILRHDQKVEDLERLLLFPSRKTGNPTFTRAESFCRYATEHKDDGSRIYLNGTAFIAVLDHHAKDPRWGQHRATYAAKLSSQWLLWTGQDKKKVNQKDFGLLIEDNLKDITAPVSAELLEMVRQFEATSTVEFRSAERGDNGNFALSYVQTTQSRVGQKGEVELPKGFTLTIPVFEGGASGDVQARLRFDIGGGKLVLWYELQHVAEIIESLTKALVDEITKSTGIAPFYGTP